MSKFKASHFVARNTYTVYETLTTILISTIILHFSCYRKAMSSQLMPLWQHSWLPHGQFTPGMLLYRYGSSLPLLVVLSFLQLFTAFWVPQCLCFQVLHVHEQPWFSPSLVSTKLYTVNSSNTTCKCKNLTKTFCILCNAKCCWWIYVIMIQLLIDLSLSYLVVFFNN